jgi:hypothetical protein
VKGDKHYFLDLQHKGIAITDFIILEKGSTAPSLKSVMESNGWSQMVVKACVSCYSFHILFIFSNEQSEDFQSAFEEFLS